MFRPSYTSDVVLGPPAHRSGEERKQKELEAAEKRQREMEEVRKSAEMATDSIDIIWMYFFLSAGARGE